MPAGYMQHDDGAIGVRSSWTAPSTVTAAATWLTSSVFKYTGLEILARGWAADSIKAQVSFQWHVHVWRQQGSEYMRIAPGYTHVGRCPYPRAIHRP